MSNENNAFPFPFMIQLPDKYHWIPLSHLNLDVSFGKDDEFLLCILRFIFCDIWLKVTLSNYEILTTQDSKNYPQIPEHLKLEENSRKHYISSVSFVHLHAVLCRLLFQKNTSFRSPYYFLPSDLIIHLESRNFSNTMPGITLSWDAFLKMRMEEDGRKVFPNCPR